MESLWVPRVDSGPVLDVFRRAQTPTAPNFQLNPSSPNPSTTSQLQPSPNSRNSQLQPSRNSRNSQLDPPPNTPNSQLPHRLTPITPDLSHGESSVLHSPHEVQDYRHRYPPNPSAAPARAPSGSPFKNLFSCCWSPNPSTHE
jgi:hypothetical protein